MRKHSRRYGPGRRALGLSLALLVFGAAGADGLRSCPHHGDDPSHGFGAAEGVFAGEHATADDPPFHDPGPCDHDLGVCETIASDPRIPTATVAASPAHVRVESGVFGTQTTLHPAAVPFLLPYALAPPPLSL